MCKWEQCLSRVISGLVLRKGHRETGNHYAALQGGSAGEESVGRTKRWRYREEKHTMHSQGIRTQQSRETLLSTPRQEGILRTTEGNLTPLETERWEEGK